MQLHDLRKTVRPLLLGLGILASTASFGVTIVNQPPLDQGDAFLSTWTSGSQYADNFHLNTTATLDSIEWWGSYSLPGDDDFKIGFYSGTPDAAPLKEYTFPDLVVTSTATGLTDSGGNTVYHYSAALPSLQLLGGDYFISIVDNDDVSSVNNNTPAMWLWLSSASGDNQNWFRSTFGETWTSDTSPIGFAFALSGTQQSAVVPEPEILPLMGLGLLVLFRRAIRPLKANA